MTSLRVIAMVMLGLCAIQRAIMNPRPVQEKPEDNTILDDPKENEQTEVLETQPPGYGNYVEISNCSSPNNNANHKLDADASHAGQQRMRRDATFTSTMSTEPYAPGSNYSLVSCDFTHDSCGWENVGGDDYSRTWYIDTRKNAMYINMNGGKTGRLASPWLEPLKNYACSLTFRYFMSKGLSYCYLRLIRETSGDNPEPPLFETSGGTSIWGNKFSNDICRKVNCGTERFRLVFEAGKECAYLLRDQIGVKNIRFNLDEKKVGAKSSPETTSSTRHSSATPTTTTTPTPSKTADLTTVVTSQDGVTSSLTSRDRMTLMTQVTRTSRAGDETSPASLHTADDESSEAGSGVLTPIVVTVVVVIIVVVIVIIVVLLRRRKNRGPKPPIRCAASRDAARHDGNMAATENRSGIGPTDTHRTQRPNRFNNEAYELAENHLPSPSVSTTNATTTTNNSNDNNPYNHLDGRHFPPTSPSSASITNPYDHIDRGPSNDVLPSTSANIVEDPYDHTHSKDVLPKTSADAEDPYNHTHTKDVLPMAEDPYDHTHSKNVLPATSANMAEDPYDHTYTGGSRASDHRRGKDPRLAKTSTDSQSDVYSLAGPMGIETGNEASASSVNDVYNILGEVKDGQRSHESPYDHAGSCAREGEYSTMDRVERRKIEQREAVSDLYSHI